MSDFRLGSALRAVRVRRGWRQVDVVARAGVSAATISYVERGRLGATSLDMLRRVATVLEIRIDVIPRWRGGELDRLISARHAFLTVAVIELLNRHGWQVAPEVSFSVYGERGVIDLLAWHAPSRALLVIELKTEIVDANELLGVLDRKARLAGSIARERGWIAGTVSTWLVIADSSTNRALVNALKGMLRAALQTTGRDMKAWLRAPAGRVACLSFFQNSSGSSVRREWAGRRRVRLAKSSVVTASGASSGELRPT